MTNSVARCRYSPTQSVTGCRMANTSSPNRFSRAWNGYDTQYVAT